MSSIRHLVLFFLFCTYSLTTSSAEPPLITDPNLQFEAPELPSTGALLEPMDSPVSHQVDDIITDIHFAGGTVIPLVRMAEMVKPLLNQSYSIELVTQTVKRITQAYQRQGYPLSYASVGSNSFQNGKLTITLIEGYVIRSEIDISESDFRRKVEQILEPVLQQRPLSQDVLERAVLLVKQIPGYQFDVLLPKPKTRSGATSIRVQTKSLRQIEPTLAVSKQRYSDESISLGVMLNGYDDFFDQLVLTALLPIKDRDERYFGLSVNNDWHPNGLKGVFKGDFYQDNSSDDFIFNDFDLDYQQDLQRVTVAYQLGYPLKLTNRQRIHVKAGVKHVNEQNQLRFFDQETLIQTASGDVRYSLATLGLEFAQLIDKVTLMLGVEAAKNIDLGSAQGNYDRGFTRYQANALVRYPFLSSWQVDVRLNGVYSGDTMASNEQPNYGGVKFASGYPEGQAQGDRGYGAQLRLLKTLSFSQFYVRPYVQLDRAFTEYVNVDVESRLASVALGTELGETNAYSISLEYAKPLDDNNVITGDKSPLYNLRFSWKI